MNSPIEARHLGRYLQFVETEKGWEYVRRAGGAHGVSILAVTPEGRILLVDQYRPPVARRVIELPAGLVSTDEEEIATVHRELLEETGYRCEDAVPLWSGTTTPGLTDEMSSLYFARRLSRPESAKQEANAAADVIRHRTTRGLPEEGEAIIVFEVPRNALLSWLEEQERAGSLVDIKLFAAIYLAQQKGLL